MSAQFVQRNLTIIHRNEVRSIVRLSVSQLTNVKKNIEKLDISIIEQNGITRGRRLRKETGDNVDGVVQNQMKHYYKYTIYTQYTSVGKNMKTQI